MAPTPPGPIGATPACRVCILSERRGSLTAGRCPLEEGLPAPCCGRGAHLECLVPVKASAPGGRVRRRMTRKPGPYLGVILVSEEQTVAHAELVLVDERYTNLDRR